MKTIEQLFADWTQEQLDGLLDLSVEEFQRLVETLRAEQA